MAEKTGISIAFIGIGALMVWSSIRNQGVLTSARDIISGKQPTPGTPQSLGFGIKNSSASSDTSSTITTQGDVLIPMGDSSAAAAGAVQFATAQVGKPYVWGATGPDSYDCSGLQYAAYKSVGVSIPRISQLQMYYGTSVPVSSAIPGDLLFPEPGHVVMCIGGGQCVESPHTGLNVRIRPYSPSEFVMCRRVA